MPEHFNKTSKKFQTTGLDVFEGYLLLSSLFSFIKELWENSADRIAYYESEVKGLCEDITSSYSDASKCIVTKKFSDGTSDSASLRGADKFRMEVLNQIYDCLVIQLCKGIDPYEQIAKRFKFLSELMNNSEIDEDSIKLIISYYNDEIDHKLILRKFLLTINKVGPKIYLFFFFQNELPLCNVKKIPNTFNTI